ncbi:MAG: rod shape-determining protein MreD [Nitrospirae bacterium]|nr:rod shape-determining protein MreD [Nitrospirota bacterium]
MKKLLLLTIGLIIVSLQSSLANSIALLDVKPDLIFIFVYALGLIYNEEKAILMGAGLGFASDVFSGGPLGLNLLTKGITGFASGLLGKRAINMRLRLQILVIFFVTILEVLTQAMLIGIFSRGAATTLWIKAGFLQALYNSLFAFLFLWPLIKRLMREREWAESLKASILIR